VEENTDHGVLLSANTCNGGTPTTACFNRGTPAGAEAKGTLQGSVRCSAFAKCLILIPLHENIYKDYGFFEDGTERKSLRTAETIFISCYSFLQNCLILTP
jgi:hypothetical protein